MKQLVRFPRGHELEGYGFDIISRKVYSFKRDPNGKVLKDHPTADGYTIGPKFYKTSKLVQMARVVNASSLGHSHDVSAQPSQFIVFNKNRNYSKMFSGVSVAEAVQKAATETGADSMTFQVMDTSNNKVYNVVAEEVVVRRVVGIKAN